MTHLLDLPSECLLELGQFLSIPEISLLRRTCRTMSDLFAADKYWHCAEFERFIDKRNVHKTKLETYRDAYACLQLDNCTVVYEQRMRSRYHITCIKGAYIYRGLRELRFINCAILELPRELEHAQSIDTIDIRRSALETINADLSQMNSLHTLTINDCHLHEVPNSVYRCMNLRNLSLRGDKILRIHHYVADMFSLTNLDVSYNAITKFPTVWKNDGQYFINLSHNPFRSAVWSFATRNVWLDVSNTYCKSLEFLHVIPSGITSTHRYVIGNKKIFDRVSSLSLQGSKLRDFPISMRCLHDLDLSNNMLENIPESITMCLSLRTLKLRGNRIKNVDSLCRLTQLRNLDVSDNLVEHIPRNLFGLRLQQLSVRGCNIHIFPDNLCNELLSLDISGNFLSKIPRYITRLTSLERLVAAHNRIDHITKHIYSCAKLDYIDLSHNFLVDFPSHMNPGQRKCVHVFILHHNSIRYRCNNNSMGYCGLNHVTISRLDLSYNDLQEYIDGSDVEFGFAYFDGRNNPAKNPIYMYNHHADCSITEYGSAMEEIDDVYGDVIEHEGWEDNFGTINKTYRLEDYDDEIYVD